jgi:hypothetical protein
LKTGTVVPPLEVIWCIIEPPPADSPMTVILRSVESRLGKLSRITTKKPDISLCPVESRLLIQETGVCNPSDILKVAPRQKSESAKLLLV